MSTQENPTKNTIMPAGSVIAASNPPVAAKPDCTTFLKELDALHNKLFIHLMGALIVSTQETHTDTIMPTGSVIAASNPPAAAKPDCITYLKELDTLYNKITLMLLPRTFLPCTTKAKHTETTIATNDNAPQPCCSHPCQTQQH